MELLFFLWPLNHPLRIHFWTPCRSCLNHQILIFVLLLAIYLPHSCPRTPCSIFNIWILVWIWNRSLCNCDCYKGISNASEEKLFLLYFVNKAVDVGCDVISQNFAWEMSRGRARIYELWILFRYGMKLRSPTGGINEIFCEITLFEMNDKVYLMWNLNNRWIVNVLGWSPPFYRSSKKHQVDCDNTNLG